MQQQQGATGTRRTPDDRATEAGQTHTTQQHTITHDEQRAVEHLDWSFAVSCLLACTRVPAVVPVPACARVLCRCAVRCWLGEQWSCAPAVCCCVHVCSYHSRSDMTPEAGKGSIGQQAPLPAHWRRKRRHKSSSQAKQNTNTTARTTGMDGRIQVRPSHATMRI